MRSRRSTLIGSAASALLVLSCFPTTAGPRLRHFEVQAPAVGAPAPDFELRSVEGGVVRLSDLLGDRPIVLQLGSHSCPVYRYRRHWMDDLVREYRDRVHFLIVYTVEAHPTDAPSPYAEKVWDPWINRLTGVRVSAADDAEERLTQALRSHRKLELDAEMLVDAMDDATWKAYGSASSPAFVIDRSGRVVHRQVWLHPADLRATLDRLLGAEDEANSLP